MNRRDFTKAAIAVPFVSSISGTLECEVREYEDPRDLPVSELSALYPESVLFHRGFTSFGEIVS